MPLNDVWNYLYGALYPLKTVHLLAIYVSDPSMRTLYAAAIEKILEPLFPHSWAVLTAK